MNINKVELTEEEQTLLCKMYLSAEKINNGELNDYQLKALEHYREMKDYLAKKYSDQDFEIVSFDDDSGLSTIRRLVFTTPHSDNMFSVVVKGKNEEGYKDDYSVSLYTDMYIKRMKDIFVSLNCTMYIDAYIDGYTDENFTFSRDNDDISKLYDVAKFRTALYIDKKDTSEEQKKQIVERVVEMIRSEKQYGSYEVCFVDFELGHFENTKECVDYCKNNRSQVEHHLFNTFDLRRN